MYAKIPIKVFAREFQEVNKTHTIANILWQMEFDIENSELIIIDEKN